MLNSLWLGKNEEILLGGLPGWMHNLGAQQAVREHCAVLGGKAGFPLGMFNFQEEAAQLSLD